MIYLVKDKAAFKRNNLENWYKNSEFWLQGKMRHLRDVHDSTAQILGELLRDCGESKPRTLVDFGCGEGWLLRLIEEQKLGVDYIGVDFNDKFIQHLSERYRGRKDARFVLYDLEDELPAELVQSADMATNLFNFFEIPDIQAAIRNVARAIRPGGVLLILTIDPIMQILAVSESFDEFRNGLKEYEKNQLELGYDKDIDVGDFRSGRIYKSLLYSAATYVQLAKKNGLQLLDYREVVKTGNFVPQIYEYVVFRK